MGSEEKLHEILKEVRRIEIQARALVDDQLAGGYSSVFRGSGVEFEEVREYVPGDDPRSVDWNVTARSGRPFIKKFVDERELSVIVILDQSASMTKGFGAWSLQEMATRFVACLGLSVLKNNDKLGLVTFADELLHAMPAQSGRAQLFRVLTTCLESPDSQASTGFAEALNLVAERYKRRSLVFVVSDFQDSAWDEAMKRCAWKHDVAAVVMSGREYELESLSPELFRAQDPESGAAALVDLRTKGKREQYFNACADFRLRLDEHLRSAGVDRLELKVPSTPDFKVIVQAMHRFFRRSMSRRSRA